MAEPDAPGPRGADSLRRSNAAAVLRALRDEGPGSRAELAARTGLAKATVGTIVAALTDAGVLQPDAEAAPSTGRGRPGRRLTLAGGRPVGVGVEVNVEYVAAVVLDLAGVPQLELTRDVPPGGDVTAHLAALARAVATRLREQDRHVLGATVAVPGLVGGDDRTAVWAPNLQVAGTGLAATLDTAFGWRGRTRVSNDADCSALAELHHGAGRGAGDLLYLTGTVGIGAGLVEGGRLLRGARGFAGEVGHLPLGAAHARCGCGRSGCWEASVGLHALLAAVDMPEAGTPVTTARAVAAAAADDPELAEAVAGLARWLGRGLGVLAGVLDPGRIVLGGYFAPLGDLVVVPARRELAATLATSDLGVPDLVLGELGTEAAATGAAQRSLADVFAGRADPFAGTSAAEPGDAEEAGESGEAGESRTG
ncbi:ROK family transcriptional regulator [Nocardioides sp. zg-536]|uniref:ROK family transcriptional regulator n=1 Tax=Nocardioides faecalis TaxID=2803858 RepID=A0A938Y8B9_9ACTN|nr:ROK family transcriptional regulator [Nocardioides faecalis]MBM9459705.1 ROK family transcriptional regulator [Nocardioides faecalis]QVI58224.1 ROK family transcriptional regulator [Nocardioides faecalis]